MLKIRMQRTGRINSPSFRIIVVEHTEGPKTGNFVEKLGTYNPKSKQKTLNAERIKYWLSVGAKASGTVHNMLISAGIIEGKKVNVLPKKSPPKPAPPDSAKATTGEEGSGEVKKDESAAAEVPVAAAPAAEEAKVEEKEAEKVETPAA